MTTIQIRNAGRMWHVYINGACRAFASTYRSAKHRAAQLQGGAV